MYKCIGLIAIFAFWSTASHPSGPDICRDGGTRNISDIETINVTSFYNSNSRSIKINITTENLRHTCINVVHKYINKNSSREECDPLYYYSYFAENSAQKNTIYPASHANTHEFLQAGCTYEVYVRDENGDYAQKEFTAPECFMELCNCKHLHPKIEIVKIKQTGASQLQVKWRELRTENTRVQEKMYWWVKSANGSKMRCDNTKMDSDSTLLNCSGYLTAENYTLNAGFKDGFECKGKEEMQFLGVDLNPKSEAITNNLLKQSGGRVIEVVAVYNADYKILQLNISWNDVVTETTKGVVYLKSQNRDPSNRCYINVSNEEIVGKKLSNILLPHVDENYTLLPGCSYKISVQTGTVNENVQYRVPGCVENYIFQLETPPVLTKNYTLIEVEPLDFILKTVSVFTSNLFFICDCAPVEKNSQKSAFNCTSGLKNDFSYIIELSLTDKKDECGIKYLQTLAPMPTKRLSRSANSEHLPSDEEEAALRYTNPTTQILSTKAFYNANENVIQLNISFASQENDLHIHVMASPTNKANTCDSSYIYERILSFSDKSKITNVAIPIQPSSRSEEIQSSCAYEIRIGDSYVFNYTVPVCVGPICNYCSNSTPEVEIKSITQTAPYILNIIWMLKTPTYNISQVEFKYRENETSHIPHRCKLLSSSHSKNITDEIYSIVDCKGLVDGTKYVLIATVTNHFNCTRVVSSNFTGIGLDNAEEVHRHHLWIEIPAFFAILLLVSMILYYKRGILLEKFKLSNTRIESYEIYEPPAVGETRKAQECYNIIYCESEILSGNMDQYEIPRTRVKIIKLLDSGAFGQVFSARILGTADNKPLPPVAVKTLRDHAPPEELEDFLSEIDILKSIGEHPNIVKLIGCCTLKQPYMMIMELVPCGSLKTYLLKLRKRWENYKTNDSVFLDSIDGDYIQPDTPSFQTSTVPSHKLPSLTETEYTNVESEGHTPLLTNYNYSLEPALDHTELQNFALQIAKGMAYLEEKQITHRDLAARNVLINEFKNLKISDFGLSRIGPYINSKTKKLPLRWMSIEAIEDHFYNNKSDVWSFGIVLWEIGSLGAIPYENTPDASILHDLLMGKRLEKPGICTDDLYNLMLKCWSHDPNSRPTFAELVEQLDTKKTKIYVDFSQLNPTYVFPPSTLEKMTNTQVVTER